MDVESGDSTTKLVGEIDPKHGRKGNPSLARVGSNSVRTGGVQSVRAKLVVRC